MKDCVVGCASGYNKFQLQYWVNSINQSGFTGDKVLIVVECDEDSISWVESQGFEVVNANSNDLNKTTALPKAPIHVTRFFHIYNFLKSRNYRYVITTDVRDVVFQKNPIEFIEKNIGHKQLIFASESIAYKDEAWGNQNLLDTFGEIVYNDFKDKIVYNVGVVAGTFDAVKDLVLNIFVAASRGGTPICDQSFFNLLIATKPYADISLYCNTAINWTAQIGTTADTKKLKKFIPFLTDPQPLVVDDKIVTYETLEYFIVHQYDRNRQMKEIIETKYKII
jgi:hypothetical protein